ncbi:MAG: excinuclease ABC subunit UvrA [Bacteroidota bacterium]|nr:excinuclease ABC subunit UvrA [Bacteroidota bacterium]
MMNRDNIIIKNAHTNNLKNIDIEIPKHKLVAFTGVSGSGKSSLLFDTIYTEAQRQLIETFGTFARSRLPKLSRPDVEEIYNLSTPIVIDQKRLGNNLRSTVGTVTELATYIRLLYSRIGRPFLNLPSFAFSFNHPEGMCPHCHGLGKQVKIDVDRFIDKEKSIREGAIQHTIYKTNSYMLKELISYKIFDVDKKLKDYTGEELDKLLYSEPVLLDKAKTSLTYNRYFEGIARKLENAVIGRADDESEEEDRNAYNQFFVYRTCEHCNGTRINERARSVTINGVSIDEVFRMELSDVLRFMREIDVELSRPIIRKVTFLLEQLTQIGVGYLSLERPVSTLSGGESQRVKMAKQLNCDLTDLLYVLDEPTIGLHPRDTEKLLSILSQLKDKGNSVFVVEHDPDIIRAAEWVVDIGPAAGKNGGSIVFNGPAEGLLESEGLTGKYLSSTSRHTCKRKSWKEYYQINHATANNLKDLSVRIPKGVLTCITGVAGCGKSSLIHGCFVPEHPEAVVIDQSPIGRTSRGNIVTFIGAFDMIRKVFAENTGQDASLFSFNSKGACPKCKGQGVLTYDMHFLDSVKTRCDECDGKRYKQEVLDLSYLGKSIFEVLDMTVNQAEEFFNDPKIDKHLQLLQRVGLGYLKLGQSLSTLSGGECQRLKIATELRKSGSIYVMDEPTTGLHLSDIENFYKIVRTLVDKNNTVVIIEHNLDIIKYADWIIDLGPEGGQKGGRLIFEGLPEDLVHCRESYTGKYLKEVL